MKSAKPKILIVDDSPENLQVLMEILKEEYAVIPAINGKKALELASKNYPPDMILLDVMMPEMDGYEVCNQLKKNKQTADIPIMFLTALTETQDEIKGFELGAVDYITKPINPPIVKARIKTHLTIEKLTQTLKHQNQELQEALQLREDLAHMIVHDLRNPLQVILLSSEIMGKAQLNQIQQKQVKRIFNAGIRLNTLIEEILMMAKVKSGNLILKKEPTNLQELITKAIENIQALANSRDIQLVQNIPENIPEIQLDAILMQRVIENLLSNSIKFSPEESTIKIEVSQLNNLVSLRVLDQGKGVSDEFKHKIFEKYEIGQSLEGIQQTGLGLAFCKLAVEAHDGKIRVEDNHPQGAIFIVEFELT